VAAQIACWIDALNREAGQIVHIFRPPAALRGCKASASAFPTKKAKRWRELWRERPVVSRENATRYSGAIAETEIAVKMCQSPHAM